MTEIWKQIKDYPNYEVSNLGSVKSLKREVWCVKNNSYSIIKERVLKPAVSKTGYLTVSISKKTKKVHQLVAIAFLNHNPDGYKLVVNHINFIKSDNRLENLEIVTQRENSNRKHIKSSSSYTGVSLYKRTDIWLSTIFIDRKLKHLGYFKNEYDAHLAYQRELKLVLTKLKEKQL